MKSFKEYLAEEQYSYDNPIVGDVFAFEINGEQLIESIVGDLAEDGIIIEADSHALALLESYGLLEQGQPGPHPVDSISPIHGGDVDEAKYHGKEVPLGKKMAGDVKKSKVYVRDPSTGNIKKVNFGDKNMRIKKSNPKRRKSFRARHHCENPGPRTKARYWSCRSW